MQFSKELLKGAAELIVLKVLKDHGEAYGYQLIQVISTHSGHIFELQEGTLYPLLYRLEANGYVSSRKKTAPSGKERRYYSLTRSGEKLLASRSVEVLAFMRGMKRVLHLAV